MKSPFSGSSSVNLLQASGAILLAASIFSSGCTMPGRYTPPPSYQSEFRLLVQDYRRQSEQIASSDHTVQSTAVPETKISLKDDPLSAPGRVQADLPAKETSLEDLYVSALTHSSQIRVFSDLPLIRETSIQEAEGAFDVNAFVEGRYDSLNDPVGSTLTTGGAGRYEEDKLGFRTGLRKKVAATGAETYVTQELGRTKNNSVFFQPNPQVEARLVVGVVQPLLNGAGYGYNRSIIQIAEIDSEIAQKELAANDRHPLRFDPILVWTVLVHHELDIGMNFKFLLRSGHYSPPKICAELTSHGEAVSMLGTEFSPRRHEGHESFRRVPCAHRSVSGYLPQRRKTPRGKRFRTSCLRGKHRLCSVAEIGEALRL
jgi:hypothetical protein